MLKHNEVLGAKLPSAAIAPVEGNDLVLINTDLQQLLAKDQNLTNCFAFDVVEVSACDFSDSGCPYAQEIRHVHVVMVPNAPLVFGIYAGFEVRAQGVDHGSAALEDVVYR